MTDIEKVINGLEHCAVRHRCNSECPYSDIIQDQNEGMDSCITQLSKDALELLKVQQAEVERLKAEKNRVIEQIESEIYRLFKERGCVKDDVGIAQYQWLINGYQSALDMIKDGEQE